MLYPFELRALCWSTKLGALTSVGSWYDSPKSLLYAFILHTRILLQIKTCVGLAGARASAAAFVTRLALSQRQVHCISLSFKVDL
jgi:hypothetical protein